MAPPGFPDFLTRHRIVEKGISAVEGRAWSGAAPIAGVEFGVDGNWQDAILDQPIGEFAWRRWSVTWRANPGEHVLSCRAIDADGVSQPLDQFWNWQGMGNNQVQTVAVTVR